MSRFPCRSDPSPSGCDDGEEPRYFEEEQRGLDRARAAALATAFTSNGRFTLPFSLGARLFVEATLPEFGVETGSLHFTLESAEGPFKAFVVLNSYVQRMTTPLR